MIATLYQTARECDAKEQLDEPVFLKRRVSATPATLPGTKAKATKWASTVMANEFRWSAGVGAMGKWENVGPNTFQRTVNWNSGLLVVKV